MAIRLLAALALVLSCRAAGPAPRPNVLLVVVDTLRASHLSLYGYPLPNSPVLERLAEDSVVFEQARAPAPCTFPSVNALLTSRSPRLFVGRPGQRMGIPEGIPSIAELLAAAGYTTAAVTASPIVRRGPTRFNPEGGFDRGFETFDEECLWRSAACVHEKASALLRETKAPFFLYLHYLDPHGPYEPPADWPRVFSDAGFRGPEWARTGDPNAVERILSTAGAEAVDSAAIDQLRGLYDDEIGYFDHELGRLLDELRELGRLDESLVVLTSDHGEQFLEHGQIKHCKDLYDEEIHVPLVVRPPGGIAGRRVATPVSLLDLTPTILAYTGILASATSIEGRSLRPWIERRGGWRARESEGEQATAPTFSEWGDSRAVTDGRFKLVVRRSTDRVELYDLAADPGETIDLSERASEERERLLALLRDTLDHPAGPSPGDRLRALGYIE